MCGVVYVGENVDYDFWQVDFGFGVVGCKNLVCCQWQFVVDIQCGVGQGRGNWFVVFVGFWVYVCVFDFVQNVVYLYQVVYQFLGRVVVGFVFYFGDDVQVYVISKGIFV